MFQEGACFTLQVHAPERVIGAPQPEQEEDLPLPALHILLVEDIELNVIVARSVLDKLGCTTEVAMTGAEALELFDPEEFDMVLLDIQLPDMTGLDVARSLHQRFSGQQLPPLVALTANVLKDKKEYLDAGMDDVLSKPLAVPALTAVISKYWNPHKEEVEPLSTLPVPEVCKHFDVEMLEQYLELVGPQLIYDSLTMFEKMMPGYLDVLDSNMMARDQKGIAEEGHKIKGAAGSVGLKYLQEIARQIQAPELPAWWDNVQEWIDELRHEWRQEADSLRRWVKAREKEKR